MNRTALIVGATGGIGSETALALVARGWKVRALNRNPDEASKRFASLGVDWVKGDAMNAEDVVRAAEGVSVVVHAASPAGYRNWKGLALLMLESSIAAAKAAGARLMFPGNVYNFGLDALPLVSESSPQHPVTRKGKIRVEMEERLEAASRSGVAVLIVRAGDFFGVHAGSSWFSQGFVKPGKPLSSVSYPGDRDVGHAWAYLPDMAETIALLLERDAELSSFEVFNFRGHWFPRGVELAEATRAAAGKPAAPIRGFPWFAIYLMAPFNETFREMLEMRYLWKTTLELDNGKLVRFLGREPHTALDVALRETLKGLGVAA
ncbi:MAG TPA: SDR family NAD(P)-dependent oxidoreductase [Polyangiaceae bacterium]|jgi:nucleoside-diphosphate-sugar epimerase|nr:SDR family NAD(P)-dependent oxidoreductase [Polyangiaceae bacterium]